MKTSFILVRHGETEWNRAGRIQGHADSPLTREGVLQAEAMGRRLARESIDAVIASDLGRAHHTAAILCQHVPLAITAEPRLRERSFGVGEGLTYAEIDERFPEMFSRVRQTDPDFAAPGGESRRQFHERVVSGLIDLSSQHAGRRILVVTHGGVLAALYRWLKKLPISSPHTIEIPNVGYNALSHAEDQWQIDVWADVSHLATPTHNDRV